MHRKIIKLQMEKQGNARFFKHRLCEILETTGQSAPNWGGDGRRRQPGEASKSMQSHSHLARKRREASRRRTGSSVPLQASGRARATEGKGGGQLRNWRGMIGLARRCPQPRKALAQASLSHGQVQSKTRRGRVGSTPSHICATRSSSRRRSRARNFRERSPHRRNEFGAASRMIVRRAPGSACEPKGGAIASQSWGCRSECLRGEEARETFDVQGLGSNTWSRWCLLNVRAKSRSRRFKCMRTRKNTRGATMSVRRYASR